jgi:hypothetical protein
LDCSDPTLARNAIRASSAERSALDWREQGLTASLTLPIAASLRKL